MQSRQLVLGHVGGVDASDLGKELDDDVLGHGGVEVADVADGFLVAVFDVREGCHRVIVIIRS